MFDVKRILCPTDFSPESRNGLLYATQVAALFDAELHILHVTMLQDFRGLDLFPSFHVLESTLSKKARTVLDDMLPSDVTKRLRVTRVEQRGPAAGPGIIDYVAEHEIDLIIMSTHGRRGLQRIFLGSVSQEVVRWSPVPVLTVRGHSTLGEGEDRAILVPVDFSPVTTDVLTAAAKFARWTDRRVVLLHVDGNTGSTGTSTDDRDVRYRQTEALGATLGLEPGRVSVEIGTGPVADTILEACGRLCPELLVLGSHNAGAPNRTLIGSIADRVIQRADCPILTFKSTTPNQDDRDPAGQSDESARENPSRPSPSNDRAMASRIHSRPMPIALARGKAHG